MTFEYRIGLVKVAQWRQCETHNMSCTQGENCVSTGPRTKQAMTTGQRERPNKPSKLAESKANEAAVCSITKFKDLNPNKACSVRHESMVSICALSLSIPKTERQTAYPKSYTLQGLCTMLRGSIAKNLNTSASPSLEQTTSSRLKETKTAYPCI